MTRTRVVAAIVACAVVGSVAAPAGVGTADAATEVSVTVGEQDLATETPITVTDQPRARIKVTGDAPVEAVSVRVNGTTQHVLDPDGASVSRRVDLDLEQGPNRVTVVVEADSVQTASGVVRLDTTRPRIAYTSPFSTSRLAAPPDRTTVDGANVTLAGDLSDVSRVKRVRVEWVYTYRFAGQSRRSARTYRLDDPGERFAQPLLLGLGENEVTVTAVDVHGHTRTHTFTLDVDDTERPRIELETVERDENGTVRLAGRVTDNVKLDALAVSTSDASGERFLVNPTDLEPESSRTSRSFATTVSVGSRTDQVLLRATDVAGNTRELRVPVDYTDQVEPTITIDAAGTRFDDDTVTVQAAVHDGEITSVQVETVGPTGQPVDLETVHSGSTTDRVAVATELAAADGETTVRIRVRDTSGAEQVRAVTRASLRSARSSNSSSSGGGTNASVAASVGAGSGQAVTGGDGSITPVSLERQAAPRVRVLLDQDRRALRTVRHDGQTYTVYRYDHVLPYASGVEIYADGERVTDPQRARAVARIVGWQRAAGRVGPEDRDELRRVLEQTRRIERIVTPPLNALDGIVGVIDRLKTTSALGVSLWDLATRAYPQLEQFEAAVRTMQTELREWKQASAAVNDNVPPVLTALDRMERGRPVDYRSLPERFRTAQRGTDRLASKSASVATRLSRGSSTSAEIAAELESVQGMPGWAPGAFDQLSGVLGEAAARIDEFRATLVDQRQTLASTRSEARSEQARLMNQWQTRGAATQRTYGTLGGAGLVLIGGLTVLVWRRRGGPGPGPGG